MLCQLLALCEGNPPVTGGFPSQRANNLHSISVLWCHHEKLSASFLPHSLVRGIHWSLVDSPHKGPVICTAFPCYDVITRSCRPASYLIPYGPSCPTLPSLYWWLSAVTSPPSYFWHLSVIGSVDERSFHVPSFLKLWVSLVSVLFDGNDSFQFYGLNDKSLTLLPLDKMDAILADIFNCIFLNENDRIPNEISLKYLPRSPTQYKPALVQVMAWRLFIAKPLTGPMMTHFIDAYMWH